MKFSVFYVLEAPDHDFRRAYREMLAEIDLAEELGFDSVWLAEHHGSDYGSIPSPQVAAAAIAARTERLRIGIAVSNLTFDWPVRIAEDYAMVDVLSDGRLDLGVGRGYQPHEFRAMGAEALQDVSREVFDEALQIITGLWAKEVGEPYSFIGKHFQIRDVDCRPTPVQKPAPPIYVASISPETFDLVAEHGYDMLVTPTLMTMPELSGFIVRTKRALMARGCDAAMLDFPMNWQIHLAECEETAIAQATGPLERYFQSVMSAIPSGPQPPRGYERYAALAANGAEGAMTIDGLREGGVCYLGTPAGLIDEIETLREETGLNHVICWMRFGGMSHEDVASSMRLFAEHVIPHFKDAGGPATPRSLRHETAESMRANSFEDSLGYSDLDTIIDHEITHHEGELHEPSRH